LDQLEFNAIGSHCFAGLIIKGFEKHFNVLASFEPGGYARETMEYNFPNMNRIEGSEKHDKYEIFKGIDLIFGNPVCSGFSITNTSDRGSDSKQNWSIKDYIETVKLIDPTVFVYESVQGHWTKGKQLLMEHVNNFPDYKFTFLLTNALLHNVSQNRPRFFCIGSKLGYVHFEKPDINNLKTVKDAIQDLESRPQDPDWNHITWKDNYKHVDEKVLSYLKPCKSVNDLEYDQLNDRMKEIRDRGKSFGFHSPRRIRYDYASPVIYGGRLVHPVKHRVLTCREELRLMSAPDDFIIKTKRSQTSIQVGKSVPCNVAEYVAHNIKVHLITQFVGNHQLYDFNNQAKELIRKNRKKNEEETSQQKLFR
tara:strand:- start:3029 stop:4123 length:1095 start_codon:yes stop_codon:yes gene_type:complete